MHTINCKFNSCLLKLTKNRILCSKLQSLNTGYHTKPTKCNNYKHFVQQITILQYKFIQYWFCFYLAHDHKMLFCVLTEMLNLTKLFFFFKKDKRIKNTIKATHCDSITAVVVILGLSASFSSQKKKQKKKQQLFSKTFKAFLIGKQSNN